MPSTQTHTPTPNLHEPPTLTNIVKELPTRAVLKHHVYLGRCLQHLVETADVLVAEQLHGRYLQVDTREVVLKQQH